ncbi:MAG: hypothetical protein J6V44_16305 [Methanobrevibacter sp.]|nr:hypothetical protein [Methanobrevibacter sp.]MBO7692037.1 hypothetical protein [Methanobrevibacter sp.]
MMKDTNNNISRVVRKNTTIRTSTKKSILIRCHMLQFAGALLIAIALVIIAIVYFNRDNNTVVKEVEVERIVEVEKPITVVDEEKVNSLATQMFEEYKTVYVAEANAEATEQAITEIRNSYIAKADEAEVMEQATLLANKLFEDFKAEYTAAVKAQAEAEAEAARVANVSIVKVYVYYTNGDHFYLPIQGSLYDRVEYSMIVSALEEGGYLNEYKIDRVLNRDAVEVFVGEDYTSTRQVRLAKI